MRCGEVCGEGSGGGVVEEKVWQRCAAQAARAISLQPYTLAWACGGAGAGGSLLKAIVRRPADEGRGARGCSQWAVEGIGAGMLASQQAINQSINSCMRRSI